MVANIRMLLSVAVVGLLLSGTASAADDDATYQTVFDEIARHQAQLKTGVFRAKGELLGNPNSRLPKKGRLEFFGAFDFPASKIRFDRELTSDEQFSGDDRGGQYIRSDSELIMFPGYSKDILITSPEQKSPDWIRAIDIRGLGLSGEGDTMHSQTYDWVLANYRKMKDYTIHDEGEGILRIEWNHRGAVLRQIWLDKNKSHAAIRLKITLGRRRNGEQTWNKEPLEDHKITYAETKKIWLPVEWHAAIDLNRTEKVKIEWENVNEPVDGTLFTAHAFDVKRAARILDDRSGEPITLQEFPK